MSYAVSRQKRGIFELRPRSLTLILLAALLSVSVLSLCLGSGVNLYTSLTLSDPLAQRIVFELRAPRLCLALANGALLALCGATLQAHFRNPLADPGLIGVSSGAGLGAAVALALGFAAWQIAGAAFAGALLATLAVQQLSRWGARSADLLLAGIALNALCAALLALLLSLAPDPLLRGLTFWLMGSLALADWLSASTLLLLGVVTGYWLCRHWQVLNALLLGEQVAQHSGFAVARLRRQHMLVVALAMGCSVALSGVIGFVGLLTPHAIRLLSGGSYRHLLPLSALAGAVLLASADLVARLAFAPAELPIGAITSLAGAPFFLWLLRRRHAC